MPPPAPLHRAILFVFVASLLWGCASSQPSTQNRAEESKAIGTWEYRVQGPAPLDRGLFRISRRNGRLRAIVRDRFQGRLYARVDVHDSRLELTIDELRISGQIDDDHFRGFLRLQRWDVSMRPDVRRPPSALRRASITAERVESVRPVHGDGGLDCRSILREANGCP